MIPKECKRLAEVDFPIAVVSKHSAREKSIRHGHPSTLHLWWARRPLAACRSMLLALLLPDPCDPHCLAEFKNEARTLFNRPMFTIQTGKTDADLRQALLRFIGDFADWDNSSHPIYLEIGRGLVKAAHPEETPLVVDPFAGGGSIPLEALRLGCDSFASDLNPVACLISKVLLEDIPRRGPEFVEELRRVGTEIKGAAEKELAAFYPIDSVGGRPKDGLFFETAIAKTFVEARRFLRLDVRLTALFIWTLRATNAVSGTNGAKKERAKADEEAKLNVDDAETEDEEEARKGTRGGYSLPYDIVRRFCEPLGIHIERWNGHLILQR